MIVRTWGGRVPLEHAAGFRQHLLATGVADYRRQPGCVDVQLWRRDQDWWAHFLLVSRWRDSGAVRQYAGERPETAVLYPGDERYGLVPDTIVSHFEVLPEQPYAAGPADDPDPEQGTYRLAGDVLRVRTPAGLSTSAQYSHVVQVTGGRTAYVSGQVPYDDQGRLVGRGDFRGQAEQVMGNLRRALAAVTMDLTDIVKVTSYLADMADLDTYREVRLAHLSADAMPASTTVQAASLHPEILIEVDVVAVSHRPVPVLGAPTSGAVDP